MKTSVVVIFLTFFLLIVSCRKDDPLVRLEPLENLLVLQLDVNYEIEAAGEIQIGSNFLDQKLDLTVHFENNEIGENSYALIFNESGDTALHFYNRRILKPILESNERLAITDDRFYNKIAITDFIAIENSKFDSQLLLQSVGNSGLLHGYFNSESGNKIAVQSFIIEVFNETFQINLTERKYFVICGF